MEEQDYLLAFTHCPLFGPSRLHRVRGHFNSWEKAWEAESAALLSSGLPSLVIQTFLEHRRTFSIKTVRKKLKENDIQFVTLDDPLYPKLLRTIPLPPPLLYYQGSLEVFTKSSMAIVGTRTPTSNSQALVKKLIPTYIDLDFVIISGLARGIDTLAHETALDTNGKTVAVVPTGLDIVYPVANQHLAERIKEHGCLLSEYRPDSPLIKGNFVRRNRLMAGLSETVIAVESRPDSGAWHTITYAQTFQRKVITINKKEISGA